MNLPANHPMTSTIDDCHHGGINEWGFYGDNLYHRFKSSPLPKWNRVKRISFTPSRIKILNELVKL